MPKVEKGKKLVAERGTISIPPGKETNYPTLEKKKKGHFSSPKKRDFGRGGGLKGCDGGGRGGKETASNWRIVLFGKVGRGKS